MSYYVGYDDELIKAIRDLALKVREWAEEVAVREKFDDDLQGLCARASAKLFVVLQNAGYHPTLAYSIGHVFVIVRGLIVDVTATQFGVSERVFIRPFLEDAEDPDGWWRVTTTFSDPESLLNTQRTWDPKQQVQLGEIYEVRG